MDEDREGECSRYVRHQHYDGRVDAKRDEQHLLERRLDRDGLAALI